MMSSEKHKTQCFCISDPFPVRQLLLYVDWEKTHSSRNWEKEYLVDVLEKKEKEKTK